MSLYPGKKKLFTLTRIATKFCIDSQNKYGCVYKLTDVYTQILFGFNELQYSPECLLFWSVRKKPQSTFNVAAPDD